MSEPLLRIIYRDLKILAVLDRGELEPKQVAVIFHVTPWVVYDAVRRRKTFQQLYMFHLEQLSKTFQSNNVDKH
jgi:hypothetical protein